MLVVRLEHAWDPSLEITLGWGACSSQAGPAQVALLLESVTDFFLHPVGLGVRTPQKYQAWVTASPVWAPHSVLCKQTVLRLPQFECLLSVGPPTVAAGSSLVEVGI